MKIGWGITCLAGCLLASAPVFADCSDADRRSVLAMRAQDQAIREDGVLGAVGERRLEELSIGLDEGDRCHLHPEGPGHGHDQRVQEGIARGREQIMLPEHRQPLRFVLGKGSGDHDASVGWTRRSPHRMTRRSPISKAMEAVRHIQPPCSVR